MRQRPGRAASRRRADPKYAPVLLLQRQAVFVAPLAADHERHSAPGVERAPHLLVRQNALLDAAGIEESREPRVVGAPELVVERQERARDLAAVRIRAASCTRCRWAVPSAPKTRHTSAAGSPAQRRRTDTRAQRRLKARRASPARDRGNDRGAAPRRLQGDAQDRTGRDTGGQDRAGTCGVNRSAPSVTL